MRFIDVTHKTLVEARSPYVTWFDQQCSIGLWCTQSIVVECSENLKASLPEDQDVFYIYKDSESDDLQDHLTKELTIESNETYKQLIIVAYSEEVGDFMETLTLNEEAHEIGCEYRGLNDFLETNLANFGVELPESITKAIYDGELENERTDYVLLNNKYLELLQNYTNTIMNKGSYTSLLNSLKWFGYTGEYDKEPVELVTLREVWKHTTEDGTKLGDFDIKQILSDEFKRNLSVYSKTTYMTLRCDARMGLDGKISDEISSETSDEKPKYILNELQELEDSNAPVNVETLKVCKWAKEDMRVKMYLLGIYFEKFFCPVHIDIIRSCVEDYHLEPITVKFGVISNTLDPKS